jgi:AMMECR1 domain-containing protein
MLEHLCTKAGLPSGCWKERAQLYTFQSIIFSEKEFPTAGARRTSG